MDADAKKNLPRSGQFTTRELAFISIRGGGGSFPCAPRCDSMPHRRAHALIGQRFEFCDRNLGLMWPNTCGVATNRRQIVGKGTVGDTVFGMAIMRRYPNVVARLPNCWSKS